MQPMGGQELSHGDKTFLVEFPWAAISLLKENWGDQFFDKVIEVFETKDVEGLALLVAVGSGMKITPREVMEWSPPVIPTLAVVRKVWTKHWLGDAHLSRILAAEAAAEEKRKAEQAEREVPMKPQLRKKNLWAWLSAPFKQLFKRGSAGTTSGNNLQP